MFAYCLGHSPLDWISICVCNSFLFRIAAHHPHQRSSRSFSIKFKEHKSTVTTQSFWPPFEHCGNELLSQCSHDCVIFSNSVRESEGERRVASDSSSMCATPHYHWPESTVRYTRVPLFMQLFDSGSRSLFLFKTRPLKMRSTNADCFMWNRIRLFISSLIAARSLERKKGRDHAVIVVHRRPPVRRWQSAH